MGESYRGAPATQAKRPENKPPDLSLVAYCLTEGEPPLPLVPAPIKRTWMDLTHARTAYHCLPMVIANQAGWFILSSHSFTVRWSGAEGIDALRIFYRSGASPYPAASVFGRGILTFQMPYLFRTPPGYNLLVRGPANCPKDGASPLEGLVETDWAAATFTVNWQITRANETIVFEKDEPIGMIVPQVRGNVERFHPTFESIGTDPDVHRKYRHWAKSRREFIGITKICPADTAGTWQDHYLRGTCSDGAQAPEHQTTLRLRVFRSMVRDTESNDQSS
jgi:hypothetical protein